jgi:hypothetical protein
LHYCAGHLSVIAAPNREHPVRADQRVQESSMTSRRMFSYPAVKSDSSAIL